MLSDAARVHARTREGGRTRYAAIRDVMGNPAYGTMADTARALAIEWAPEAAKKQVDDLTKEKLGVPLK